MVEQAGSGAQGQLLELERRPEEAAPSPRALSREELKLRQPNRRQRVFTTVDVERLVGDDDVVRAVWALTQELDLNAFAAGVASERGQPGRPAWDPRVLAAVWIWAFSQGLTSAREIERQSRWRPQLQWLLGMEVVNHHTLSDFRAGHEAALDQALTRVLALLSGEGLVDLAAVAVDGTRVRAAAGGSRRRRKTIETHLAAAREAVQQLSEQAAADNAEANQRQQAARRRAARERLERLTASLNELEREEGKQNKARKSNAQKTRADKKRVSSQQEPSANQKADAKAPRVSETEPEARLQREPNGGYSAGYNAQLATDAKERIIVGVKLTNSASDAGQLLPALGDVERRIGSPQTVLADEGYNSRANIAALRQSGIAFATPAPGRENQSLAAARAAGIAKGFEAKFFIYDEASDSFRCPANETLEYRRSSRKRGRQYRQYQAAGAVCGRCEQRLLCCPKSFARGRTLSRAQDDALMASHRAWMTTDKARAAYRKRAEVAEFPNAWLKEKMGLRKFRLRGLAKARMELLWAVLAYNVAQWARLVWRPAQAAGAATA